MRTKRYIRLDEDTITARMTNTDCVTMKADGSIVLDSGGWSGAKTTREFFDDVLGGRVCTMKYKGTSTWCLRTTQGWTPFFDGMVVRDTPAGLEIVSHPKAFAYSRISREATEEKRAIYKPILDAALLLFAVHGQAASRGGPPLPWVRWDHPEILPEELERRAYALIRAVHGFEVSEAKIKAVFNAGTQLHERVTSEVSFL
jgi:hypothetical protein